MGESTPGTITVDDLKKGHEAFVKHEPRDPMYKVARFLVDHFQKQEQFSKMADGLGVLLLTWNQAFYRYGGFDFAALEECIRGNFPRIEAFASREITGLSETEEPEISGLFMSFLKALQTDEMRFSDKNKKGYTKARLIDLLGRFGVAYREDGTLRELYDSIRTNPKVGEAVEFIDKRDTTSGKNSIVINISDLGRNEKRVAESVIGLVRRSPVSVAKALHVLAPGFFPLWDDDIARGYRCYWYASGGSPGKYWEFMLKLKEIVISLEGKLADLTTSTGLSVLKLLDEFNYSKYTKGWI